LVVFFHSSRRKINTLLTATFEPPKRPCAAESEWRAAKPLHLPCTPWQVKSLCHTLTSVCHRRSPVQSNIQKAHTGIIGRAAARGFSPTAVARHYKFGIPVGGFAHSGVFGGPTGRLNPLSSLFKKRNLQNAARQTVNILYMSRRSNAIFPLFPGPDL